MGRFCGKVRLVDRLYSGATSSREPIYHISWPATSLYPAVLSRIRVNKDNPSLLLLTRLSSTQRRHLLIDESANRLRSREQWCLYLQWKCAWGFRLQCSTGWPAIPRDQMWPVAHPFRVITREWVTPRCARGARWWRCTPCRICGWRVDIHSSMEERFVRKSQPTPASCLQRQKMGEIDGRFDRDFSGHRFLKVSMTK